MRTKKGFLVLAVAALPLASVVLLQGTAVAGKVTGSGAVVCHVSGRLTFDPPLTPNGTAASKEVVTVSSSAVHCSGGTPAASPGPTVTKPIKTKGTKVGKTKIAGSCKSASSTSATIKGKQSWNGGVKPSKFVLSGLKFGLDSNGEVDEVGTSVTTGSYAGNGRVHIDFKFVELDGLGELPARHVECPGVLGHHRRDEQHDRRVGGLPGQSLERSARGWGGTSHPLACAMAPGGPGR